MKRYIFNHPTGSLVGIVLVIAGGHYAAAHLIDDQVPTVYEFFLNSDGSFASGVDAFYLGSAFVAALMGGFAGVLVVFAMTQGLRRFSVMRVKGGTALEANWLHPIVASFLAGFTLLAAAMLQIGSHPKVAGWVFEVGMLIALHASLRLVWLLARLITAVRQQDLDDLVPRPDLRTVVPDAS